MSSDDKKQGRLRELQALAAQLAVDDPEGLQLLLDAAILLFRKKRK